MDRYEFHETFKELEMAISKAKRNYHSYDYEEWVELTGSYPFVTLVKPILKKMMRYYFGREAIGMQKKMFAIAINRNGVITNDQLNKILVWIQEVE